MSLGTPFRMICWPVAAKIVTGNDTDCSIISISFYLLLTFIVVWYSGMMARLYTRFGILMVSLVWLGPHMTGNPDNPDAAIGFLSFAE